MEGEYKEKKREFRPEFVERVLEASKEPTGTVYRNAEEAFDDILD